MSEPPEQRPPKIEVMRALLEQAEAQVHLDARRPGVELPARLRAMGNVRLDYGYGLVPPIPDLSIDDDGIRATLSFDRMPFATFVPWSAVFLIADFAGRGAVWREDLPVELAAGIDATPVEEPQKPSRRFQVLDGDAAEAAPAQARADERMDEPADQPDPPPRPSLRLVK